MANIDELTKKIDELIGVIKNIGNTPNGYQLDEEDIRKKFEIETRGMDKRTKEYKKLYEEMELALEMHRKNMQRIQDENNKKQIEEQEKTLEELEKRIKSHGKNKIQLLNEEFKREKEILIAAGKDTTELEKEYAEKRSEILKSSLIDGNKTVFEELNERFEREYELYREAGEDTYELEKAYNKKRRETFVKQSQQLVGAISNLVNLGEKQLKEIEDTWGKADHAAHQYGRTVGLNSRQIEKMRQDTVSWMSDNDISDFYNIGIDEMFKVYGEYNKAIGRSVGLTHASLENMIQLKNVMGETASIKFLGSLDNFGIDVESANDIFENVIDGARKKGLVIEGLSENILNNFDLAQQYTFEDGIEGFTRMAEKATAIKWNMQQTAALAEKVSTVEGAVKTGAQLSVLGGPFAQFSNPMGMLYESLNDLEGLQDRIFQMFGNLGSWNQEKGMLDISVFNKQRIRAAASAMGLNYSDVIKTVNQQARRNYISDAIEGLDLDERTEELVTNLGQIDSNGRAYITYNNPHNNNEPEKITISELNNREDKAAILEFLTVQANSDAENLKQIAHNTLSANELIEGLHKGLVVDKADFFEGLVSKESMVTMAKSVMWSKEILGRIEMILQMISAFQAVGSSFGGFRGMGGIGGAGGAGGAAGAAGTMSRLRTGIGIGGSIAALGSFAGSYFMNQQGQRLMDNGNYEDAEKVLKGGSALGGFGTGFSIGMMTGNPIVALAGGLIGGVGGWIFGGGQAEEAQKAQEENERIQEAVENRKRLSDYFALRGVTLSSNYSDDDIKEIAKGSRNMNQVLYHNIKISDPSLYYHIPPDKIMKNGGLLNGPSHAQGGIRVGNTGIEVEGGEYVVNKQATMENYNLLEIINSHGSDYKMNSGGIMPTPIDRSFKTEVLNSHNKQHMGFDDLTINMGGGMEISLAGSNKQYVDSKELLNNPNFISGIRDEIIKQINFTTDRSFNKEKYYKKW